MVRMGPDISQEDLLRYQRATSANREVLDLLGQVSPQLARSSLHQQAVELSRALEGVLGRLLERPIEPDAGPVATT
jgi:hypothetical protein